MLKHLLTGLYLAKTHGAIKFSTFTFTRCVHNQWSSVLLVFGFVTFQDILPKINVLSLKKRVQIQLMHEVGK